MPPTETAEPEVLSVMEAAKRLDMHYVTACKMAKQGTLPGLLPRLGHRHRVSRAGLDRYLNGETGSAA